MGRPKGSTNKNKEVKEEAIYKSTTKCELCGKSIHDSPRVINLNILTNKANWHRDCKVDRLAVCNTCAKEISDIIDKYIIKKNPSLNRWEGVKVDE